MKHLLSGMIVLTVGAVFAGCSSNNDLYDENLVKENKQQQELNNLKKSYSDAFTKQFGTIASNHDWGFGNTSTTRALTRTAITTEAGLNGKFKLPENATFEKEFNNGNNGKFGQGIWAVFYQAYLNKAAGKAINDGMTKENLNRKEISQGKPFGNKAQGNVNVSDHYLNLSELVSELGSDLSSYYLQHIYKEVKGNPAHKNFGQLYAYNYSDGKWEAVTDFEKGKNNKDFINKQNLVLKGYTCMTNMGKVEAEKPLLLYDFKKSNDTSSDYRILKIEGDYYIGLEIGDGSDYTDWIIRVCKAESGVIPEKIQARIFCEDMGEIGDFDFNDVVFDAVLEDNNDITITVLASGATYKISIDGVDVTLGEMTNTGVNAAETQTFTIKAVDGKPKYANFGDIPVTVNPGGDAQPYNLEAPIGKAPQKVCTYVGVDWADEYVSIERAYTGFKTWVNSANPTTWSENEDETFTDHDLSNN